MNFDTTMGGSRRRFPETRHSLVRDAGDPDPAVRRRALEGLIASYWKPVYVCLRIHWGVSNEDAKDLTQGFFASLLESPTLARFDPARAKFRTYLRTCLDGYVSNERKAARSLALDWCKRSRTRGSGGLDSTTSAAKSSVAHHAFPGTHGVWGQRDSRRPLLRVSSSSARPYPESGDGAWC